MKRDIEIWLAKDGIKFLTEIGVKKGQVVLDFGCSVGHYTIPAAKVVGEEGKVYAVDKDRESLTQLMQIAKSKGLENIVPLTTSGTFKINLESNSVDAVLLYDILHYLCLEERRELYNEVYRILKIDGLLSIYPKHHKSDEPLWELSDIALESIIKEIENANFCFKSKSFKKLIHDNNYDKGYILNFTPLDRS
jgi:ubiquinone/menaquinone biosynthesis C-methylase UbiE